MKTVTIQIGNSDDKLRQVQWNHFCSDVEQCIRKNTKEIHFSGASEGRCIWQNACYVFCIEEEYINDLCIELKEIRANWKQDSVALTIGETNFI